MVYKPDIEKENTDEIKIEIEQIKYIELQINFLINKFMSVIGLLDCECTFKGKYYSFYSHNYLNFSLIIKIYTKTIPLIIKLLKIKLRVKNLKKPKSFDLYKRIVFNYFIKIIF